MYLNKLELFGFKSFPNKTTFKFSDGITAVVGPNGCGKTNVVDAIRWVLGEQKSSVLRSEIMENVIFNGSSTRKQMGMAEVSLSLENTRKILPTEFSEVIITRRLFRDGESNYLINNTNCRLKDILDLFMDTGMGADSYSVIELKMVEAILSGKPEERRHLFEEAAGVTKYKVRRKEAARKLIIVQNDLIRLRDLLTEVEKNVGILSRQASKTRRYTKIYHELKEIELILIQHDYYLSKVELEKFEGEFNRLNQLKKDAENDYMSSENYFKDIELEFTKIDVEYQNSINNENEIKSSLATLNKDLALDEQQQKTLMNDIDRIKIEINDADERIGLFDSEVKKIEKKSQKLEIDMQDSQKIFSLKNDEKINFEKTVSQKRLALLDINEKLFKIENEIHSLNEKISWVDSQKLILSKKKLRFEEDNQNNLSQIENLKVLQNDLISDNDLLIQKITENEKQHITQKNNQNALQNSIEKVKQKINDLKVNLATENTTLDFFSNLIEADDSTKYLYSSDKWNQNSEKTLFLEAIDSEDEYKIAIEAALGGFSNSFIVETNEEADEAIKLLKMNNKGKAGFIVKSKIPTVSEPPKLKKDENILGWISEIVKVNDDIRNCLRVFLGKTLLVKNLVLSDRLIKNGTADFVINLQGEILTKNGYYKGGSVSRREGISVGKKERISVIKKNVDRIIKEMDIQEIELKNLNESLLKIDLEKIQKNLKDLEISKKDNDDKLTQLKFNIESINKDIEQNKINLSNLELENTNFNKDVKQSKTRYDVLKSELIQVKSINNEKHHELKISEDKLAISNNDVKTAEINIIKLKTEKDSLENQINGLLEQKVFYKNKILQQNNNLKSTIDLIDTLGKKIITLNKSILDLNDSNKIALNEKDFLYDKKHTLETKLNQAAEDISLKRKANEKIVEHVHHFDLKMNEHRMKINTILEKITEEPEFKLDLDDFTFDDTFSIKENKELVQQLKEKLNSIGPVNHLALEEYEEQNKRFELYSTQLKDLNESEKNLQDTIVEINKTAEDKFSDTFEKIKINFKELFKKLFSPDAESDVRLSGDNPLESDIEIMAKPPGKKPHSIDMLSGGEKTLTAIALLFAIYLVKPSPFCILDEVDAPLDDTNIDKFITMIREFTRNTQFMIVTHNKRTMESSDTLYGITQQEEGISKIVSVRMEPRLI